jgi:hypothetical protein
MTDDARPRRIADRYAIEQELGAGGMGVVVRARDERLGRSVAIKLLSPSSVGNATARERLVQEAKSAAALDHPGIVRVYDVGVTDDGGAYLVMELIRGTGFGDAIRRGELSRAERLRVVTEVAHTLSYAQREGFIHRDIKPDNVMIRDDGRVVLLDFGLARHAAPFAGETLASDAAVAQGKRLTAEGTVVGSPGYMAPEQIAGEAVDPRADQFALGVMAYEALTGRLPWTATSVIRILMQVVGETPPPATTVDPSLPPVVDEVLGRAMAKKPEQRFPSMEAFAAALATIPRDGAPVAPRGIHEAETVTVGAADLPRTSRPSSEARPTSAPPGARRPRWALAGLALAALVAVGVGVINRRAPAPPTPAPPAAASPLADPASVIACPILEVTGVEEPSGWLGATAATMACERARVLLGGRAARTLEPAELLALPRLPGDSFPVDPYGAAGARERSLTAAGARATATLDGAVRRTHAAFEVDLALHARDGRLLADGHGAGGLVEAVRAAMAPLVASGAIPRAEAVDPSFLRASTRRDPEAILAQLDLSFSLMQFGPSLLLECARVQARPELLDALGFMGRMTCAYIPGLPPTAEQPTPIDRSSAGRLAVTIETQLVADGVSDVRALADEVQRAREAAADPEERATLAVTESCLRQSTNQLEPAYALALQAIAVDPKAEDGYSCGRFGQLISVATGSASERAATSFAQAWKPWMSTAWFDVGHGLDAAPTVDGRPGEALPAIVTLRRAYTLAPYHADIADQLARVLLRRGEREEVRAIAASLAAGPPVQQATSLLLGVRLEAAETAFAAALARAQRGLGALTGGGYVTSLRLDLGSLAVRLATLLGRGEPVADEAVRLLVEPDPPQISSSTTFGPVIVAGLCIHASRPVAERCLARVRTLLTRGFFQQSLPGADGLLDGADAYVRGDAAAAAKAWRPLVRKSPLVVFHLADAMAAVFDETKEPELAELADETQRELDLELGGVTPATARMALRADRRGDHDRARKLARRVVDAWVAADEQVPVLAAMRALLGEARGKGAPR